MPVSLREQEIKQRQELDTILLPPTGAEKSAYDEWLETCKSKLDQGETIDTPNPLLAKITTLCRDRTLPCITSANMAYLAQRLNQPLPVPISRDLSQTQQQALRQQYYNQAVFAEICRQQAERQRSNQLCRANPEQRYDRLIKLEVETDSRQQALLNHYRNLHMAKIPALQALAPTHAALVTANAGMQQHTLLRNTDDYDAYAEFCQRQLAIQSAAVAALRSSEIAVVADEIIKAGEQNIGFSDESQSQFKRQLQDQAMAEGRAVTASIYDMGQQANHEVYKQAWQQAYQQAIHINHASEHEARSLADNYAKERMHEWQEEHLPQFLSRQANLEQEANYCYEKAWKTAKDDGKTDEVAATEASEARKKFIEETSPGTGSSKLGLVAEYSSMLAVRPLPDAIAQVLTSRVSAEAKIASIEDQLAENDTINAIFTAETQQTLDRQAETAAKYQVRLTELEQEITAYQQRIDTMEAHEEPIKQDFETQIKLFQQEQTTLAEQAAQLEREAEPNQEYFNEILQLHTAIYERLTNIKTLKQTIRELQKTDQDEDTKNKITSIEAEIEAKTKKHDTELKKIRQQHQTTIEINTETARSQYAHELVRQQQYQQAEQALTEFSSYCAEHATTSVERTAKITQLAPDDEFTQHRLQLESQRIALLQAQQRARPLEARDPTIKISAETLTVAECEQAYEADKQAFYQHVDPEQLESQLHYQPSAHFLQLQRRLLQTKLGGQQDVQEILDKTDLAATSGEYAPITTDAKHLEQLRQERDQFIQQVTVAGNPASSEASRPSHARASSSTATASGSPATTSSSASRQTPGDQLPRLTLPTEWPKNPRARFIRKHCFAVNNIFHATDTVLSDPAMIALADELGKDIIAGYNSLEQAHAAMQERLAADRVNVEPETVLQLTEQAQHHYNSMVQQLCQQLQNTAQIRTNQLVKEGKLTTHQQQDMLQQYQQHLTETSAELTQETKKKFDETSKAVRSKADDAFITAFGRDKFRLLQTGQVARVTLTDDLYRFTHNGAVKTDYRCRRYPKKAGMLTSMMKTITPAPFKYKQKRAAFDFQLSKQGAIIPHFGDEMHREHNYASDDEIGTKMSMWMLAMRAKYIAELEAGHNPPRVNLGSLDDRETSVGYHALTESKKAILAQRSMAYLAARAAGFAHDDIKVQHGDKPQTFYHMRMPKGLTRSLGKLYQTDRAAGSDNQLWRRVFGARPDDSIVSWGNRVREERLDQERHLRRSASLDDLTAATIAPIKDGLDASSMAFEQCSKEEQARRFADPAKWGDGSGETVSISRFQQLDTNKQADILTAKDSQGRYIVPAAQRRFMLEQLNMAASNAVVNRVKEKKPADAIELFPGQDQAVARTAILHHALLKPSTYSDTAARRQLAQATTAAAGHDVYSSRLLSMSMVQACARERQVSRYYRITDSITDRAPTAGKAITTAADATRAALNIPLATLYVGNLLVLSPLWSVGRYASGGLLPRHAWERDLLDGQDWRRMNNFLFGMHSKANAFDVEKVADAAAVMAKTAYQTETPAQTGLALANLINALYEPEQPDPMRKANKGQHAAAARYKRQLRSLKNSNGGNVLVDSFLQTIEGQGGDKAHKMAVITEFLLALDNPKVAATIIAGYPAAQEAFKEYILDRHSEYVDSGGTVDQRSLDTASAKALAQLGQAQRIIKALNNSPWYRLSSQNWYQQQSIPDKQQPMTQLFDAAKITQPASGPTAVVTDDTEKPQRDLFRATRLRRSMLSRLLSRDDSRPTNLHARGALRLMRERYQDAKDDEQCATALHQIITTQPQYASAVFYAEATVNTVSKAGTLTKLQEMMPEVDPGLDDQYHGKTLATLVTPTKPRRSSLTCFGRRRHVDASKTDNATQAILAKVVAADDEVREAFFAALSERQFRVIMDYDAHNPTTSPLRNSIGSRYATQKANYDKLQGEYKAAEAKMPIDRTEIAFDSAAEKFAEKFASGDGNAEQEFNVWLENAFGAGDANEELKQQVNQHVGLLRQEQVIAQGDDELTEISKQEKILEALTKTSDDYTWFMDKDAQTLGNTDRQTVETLADALFQQYQTEKSPVTHDPVQVEVIQRACRTAARALLSDPAQQPRDTEQLCQTLAELHLYAYQDSLSRQERDRIKRQISTVSEATPPKDKLLDVTNEIQAYVATKQTILDRQTLAKTEYNTKFGYQYDASQHPTRVLTSRQQLAETWGKAQQEVTTELVKLKEEMQAIPGLVPDRKTQQRKQQQFKRQWRSQQSSFSTFDQITQQQAYYDNINRMLSKHGPTTKRLIAADPAHAVRMVKWLLAHEMQHTDNQEQAVASHLFALLPLQQQISLLQSITARDQRNQLLKKLPVESYLALVTQAPMEIVRGIKATDYPTANASAIACHYYQRELPAFYDTSAVTSFVATVLENEAGDLTEQVQLLASAAPAVAARLLASIDPTSLATQVKAIEAHDEKAAGEALRDHISVAFMTRLQQDADARQ